MLTLVLTDAQHNSLLRSLYEAMSDAETVKAIMESSAAKQVCDEQKARLHTLIELIRSCPGHELRQLLLDYQAMQERLYRALWEHAGDSEEVEIALHELKTRAGTLLPNEPTLQISATELAEAANGLVADLVQGDDGLAATKPPKQCEVCQKTEGPFIQVEVSDGETNPQWLAVCSEECLQQVILRWTQIGEIVRGLE